MMRRSLFLVFTLTLWLSLPSAFAAAGRPNILWLSWEDSSPRLGCYGDKVAPTPHIDSVAAKGQRYLNAFATFPVCAPTRSSIITGMFPTTIGTHQMRCQTKLPDFVRMFPAYLREAGYYTSNNSKEDYQYPGKTPPEVWNESSPRAHWKNRAEGQPFFSVFNLTRTHESQSHSLDKNPPEEGDPAYVDPRKIEVPLYYPDTPRVRETLAQQYRRIADLDRWVGEHLKALEEAGLADDTIVFCWSDHGDGRPRGKRWIRFSGVRVPLIVHIPEKWRHLLPADQYVGGGTETRLVALMDLGPTTLQLCGLEVPTHMQGRAFLGQNRPPAPEYIVCARDRMDERYDPVRGVTDGRYLYVRNYDPWRTPMPVQDYGEKHVIMQEIRRLQATGELPATCQQYLTPGKPEEELFDIETDPHEITNLANSAEHHTRLEQMRTYLDHWRRESRDLGMLPEFLVRQLEKEAGTQYQILANSPNPGDKASHLVQSARSHPNSALARLEKLEASLKSGNTSPDTEQLALMLLDSAEDYVPLKACDIIDRYQFYPQKVVDWLKAATSRQKEDEYVARIARHMVAAAEK